MTDVPATFQGARHSAVAPAPDPGPQLPTGMDAILNAETRPAGWDLLRPWSDLEFWEKSELTAILTSIETNERDGVKMTTKSLRLIGQAGKLMQRDLSVEPAKFKAWLDSLGSFDDQITALVNLLFPYAAEVGEAKSSAS